MNRIELWQTFFTALMLSIAGIAGWWSGRMAAGLDGGSKQVQLKMTDGRFCCPNYLLKIKQPIGIAEFNHDT